MVCGVVRVVKINMVPNPIADLVEHPPDDRTRPSSEQRCVGGGLTGVGVAILVDQAILRVDLKPRRPDARRAVRDDQREIGDLGLILSVVSAIRPAEAPQRISTETEDIGRCKVGRSGDAVLRDGLVAARDGTQSVQRPADAGQAVGERARVGQRQGRLQSCDAARRPQCNAVLRKPGGRHAEIAGRAAHCHAGR